MAALTFPYSLADFADLLKIESVTWHVRRNDQIDGLESGQILSSEIAPSLRTGTVNIAPLEYDVDTGFDESSPIDALIEALDGSINAFMVYGPPRLYPQSDPRGLILGANVVTITAINADNKRITLGGLPSGYVLTRGDFIQFPFGPGNTLNAYHRIVQTVAATGGGVSEIEIRPHVYPGTVIGAVCTLKKPAARVIMIPGSFEPGQVRGRFVTGKKFEVIESFK